MLAYDPTAAGSLRDVTRAFPAAIRKNVKEALHIVAVTRRQHAETLGGVASYVEDFAARKPTSMATRCSRCHKRNNSRNHNRQSCKQAAFAP